MKVGRSTKDKKESGMLCHQFDTNTSAFISAPSHSRLLAEIRLGPTNTPSTQ